MSTKARAVTTTDDVIALLERAGPSPDFAVTIARARAERRRAEGSSGEAWALWGDPRAALAAAGWGPQADPEGGTPSDPGGSLGNPSAGNPWLDGDAAH